MISSDFETAQFEHGGNDTAVLESTPTTTVAVFSGGPESAMRTVWRFECDTSQFADLRVQYRQETPQCGGSQLDYWLAFFRWVAGRGIKTNQGDSEMLASGEENIISAITTDVRASEGLPV